MTAVLSTYRVQLSRNFGVTDLEVLVPFFARLGVTHVYVSPILRARSGSHHGYDVVDHTMLNPELGSEADLERLITTLRSHQMGLILDFVPNHMATGSENCYWEDVLTHGRCSPFADWFDIDWGPSAARRPYRVFLPVLGDRLSLVIAQGELRLAYRSGAFRIDYYDQTFPVDPGTVAPILDDALAELARRQPSGSAHHQLAELIAKLNSLPRRSSREPAAAYRRRETASAALADLRALYSESSITRSCLDSVVTQFNSEGGERHLRRLLAAQAYRLAYWRRGAREINYRRFFTISHLVGLRAENARVFGEIHSRVLDWVSRGLVDGLRLDHIDGLADPLGYLVRLRAAIRETSAAAESADFPIFVEKILARDEQLREDWPVTGTTGYEFLNEVEELFIDGDGHSAVEATYGTFTRRDRRFADVVLHSKRKILAGQLAAETRRLARQLETIARGQTSYAALDRRQLVSVLSETIACLPVYRTYMDPRLTRPRAADRILLHQALDNARARGRCNGLALELLRRVLLLDDAEILDGRDRADRVDFSQRFQQLCVSAAAKGVEDTALYVHVPFASRNEVGGDPGAPVANDSSAFHTANLRRARRWPGTLLCTSTHDAKRSADVRARLDVLSELPDLWKAAVWRWHNWNREHRARVRGRFVPDRNTEYHFYQTLVGVWPFERGGEGQSAIAAALEQIRGRLIMYMRKAVREANVQTSWVEPNLKFEDALERFLNTVLSLDHNRHFLVDADAFARRIARPGLWNALSRTLIHLTAPGTPDIYQGDELWQFSLVDPDNRRPVDFARRQNLLTSNESAWTHGTDRRLEFLREITEVPEDGRLKLWVTQRALLARRADPELFGRGEYVPLTADGPQAGHIFAFARSHLDRFAVTVAATSTASLADDVTKPPIGRLWSGSHLPLPFPSGQAGWRCALSGRFLSHPPGPAPAFPVETVLGSLPVALLLPSNDPAEAQPAREPA